ncbi:Uncharacterized membrane protein [Desulfonatronum thiosulfatophilum]|uniref:Uncharacterized membrane protein n=1 Tax=Desulfonatronum thiosulfatophilum TaxID=617002 RepID=A0A1G6AX72_9BACT|nr:hypothetical protein [Desulfonatronum thiosulfatophilum]SDB12965.1 Uncharacterized membrane protein [Desulfonatronum thiosulfatophilum]
MELWSVFELMFTAQGPSEWSHWPFGPTFVGSWLNMLTKFIFIGLVLALMMYMLRYLFGPGGPMREEPEMGEEQKVELAVELLRRRMEQGRIDALEFERIKKLLQP